jgi:hypothetical protein
MDFLRGHENPELFMKLPNQVQVGEGRMGPGASAMPGTANTNPLDGGEYPYKGGWSIDACHSDVTGEGYAEGDVSQDFAYPDQNGQNVHLNSFCDREIYLVFAAFW